MKLLLVFVLVASSLAEDFPIWRHVYKPKTIQGDVGETLYLTPYIQNGDLDTARNLARVVDPLDGLDNDELESYSGFITVNEETDSHMFFWFFPATEVDPSEAPVVLWLQGGPGSSSMIGLFEIHGPLSAVYTDETQTDTEVKLNPFSWNRKANMIYIDNPVGTGFSHTSSGFADTQEEVGVDLYECLVQWFTLFPEFQSNPFFAFGESYAGKYVPTISKKIHDENQVSSFKINFQGLGIGNGAMSPVDSNVYGEYLYQAGLLDEIDRDELLSREAKMKEHVANEEYFSAWLSWNTEVNYFLSKMGCSYTLGINQCHEFNEENNYEDFVNKETTRKAAHVGDRPFGSQSGAVYDHLREDIFVSQKATVEFLLDRYPVLIYNGNLDIICHHTGTLNMFQAMETWSGLDEYHSANAKVYRVNGDVAGYLTSAQNLRLFVMRNAGHMVPRSQPENAFAMFNDFISNKM
uniref:Cathepsin A3 n=1 Tax=Tigriopus japonicus TaxID=158387 RepID=A0A0H4K811_TIGJA|nr:cathepsin A3 [Tigriopus japonicus]